MSFSETRKGNLILLIGASFWLIGYGLDAIAFAWLFILLGLLLSIIYQVDRFVLGGQNWDHEREVPRVLSQMVNLLVTVCILLAIWEFALAIMNR